MGVEKSKGYRPSGQTFGCIRVLGVTRSMELLAMLTLLFVLGLLADGQVLTGRGSVLSDETDDIGTGSAVVIGVTAIRSIALR
jgi:hypothetical protein